MKYGVGVILEKENKFLLQLRDNKRGISNPDIWALFGGTVEDGEEPIEGAIREMKEELNLNLKREDLRYITRFYFPQGRSYLYRTELKKDISELTLNEGRDMRLFSRQEIIRNRKVWLPVRLCFLFYWNKIRYN